MRVPGTSEVKITGQTANVGQVTGTVHPELLFSVCVQGDYGGAALLSRPFGGVTEWSEVRTVFSSSASKSCEKVTVSGLGDQTGDGYPEFAVGVPRSGEIIGSEGEDSLRTGTGYLILGWGI